jgi:PAS domain S-box-containing protein
LITSQASEFLRSVVEATPECVKIVSPEGKLLYMNPSGISMIDAEDATVQGANVIDLVAAEDRPEWLERHARVCAGERLSWEFDIVGLKGTRRHMETHAVPVRLPDGRMAQLAVTRDATGRREDEVARAHLAAIVDSSDDGIVSKTLDGIIRSWNAGAQRIFGYTPEEAVGQPVLMLLPKDRKNEEAGILARLRAGERVDHFQSVRVTKDGRHLDVSLTISPVKDSRGRIVGASKIVRDITRDKQSERELSAARQIAEEVNRQKDQLLESERHARQELERAGRMKDEFLANLSHELRTPLNAILGWAQILRSEPTQEDLRTGIEVIERNARTQAQIIEDLLDMSRIVSGKIRLEVQRLDLAMVVRAAVETVKPAAEAKGVRLQTVLDAFAGPVTGDPNRLQQVFWNLLTNAIKFTPKGGRVQVVLERVDSHLELSVTDTGEGIPPEFLPYVFERFRQAEGGTDRRHAGLGLGLAIVKQLVELHGGTVRVKSGGPGAGSAFVVTLPLTVVHLEADPEEPRHPRHGSMPLLTDARVKIDGVKVLVVDDETDARMLVKRVLEEHKAVVTTAASASEAIGMLAEDAPDILISDIGMPGEDGYSLIKRARALGVRGSDAPAIALTAYARPEDRMRAILAGFEQYLVKPVEPAELITLVSVLARGRRRSS